MWRPNLPWIHWICHLVGVSLAPDFASHPGRSPSPLVQQGGHPHFESALDGTVPKFHFLFGETSLNTYVLAQCSSPLHISSSSLPLSFSNPEEAVEISRWAPPAKIFNCFSWSHSWPGLVNSNYISFVQSQVRHYLKTKGLQILSNQLLQVSAILLNCISIQQPY